MSLHDLIFGPKSTIVGSPSEKQATVEEDPVDGKHFRPRNSISSFASFPCIRKSKRTARENDRLDEHLLDEYRTCPSRRYKNLKHPQECSSTLDLTQSFPQHEVR